MNHNLELDLRRRLHDVADAATVPLDAVGSARAYANRHRHRRRARVAAASGVLLAAATITTVTALGPSHHGLPVAPPHPVASSYPRGWEPCPAPLPTNRVASADSPTDAVLQSGYVAAGHRLEVSAVGPHFIGATGANATVDEYSGSQLVAQYGVQSDPDGLWRLARIYVLGHSGAACGAGSR